MKKLLNNLEEYGKTYCNNCSKRNVKTYIPNNFKDRDDNASPWFICRRCLNKLFTTKTVKTKSAKEMFEDLGYEITNDKDFVEYSKTKKDIIVIFWFSKDMKNFFKKTINKKMGQGTINPINMKELEAINKQIEELGWE